VRLPLGGLEGSGRRLPELQRPERVDPPAGGDVDLVHGRVEHALGPGRREDLDVMAGAGELVRRLDDDALDAAAQVDVGIGQRDLHERPSVWSSCVARARVVLAFAHASAPARSRASSSWSMASRRSSSARGSV
jgi:hypothetical protein